MAAFMANRGTMEGQTLLNEQTWEEMHSDVTVDYLLPYGMRTPFTKGGPCFFD